MITSLLLLLLGVSLSAFFSGTETGFYRVTRVRLVLDGLDGDWIARGLLWLSNHPALFVSTTLIGNNVANYVVSLSIVLAVQALQLQDNLLVELLAPLLCSPIIFVYAELLPKNLFYHAPNVLLRRAGAFLLIFAILFAPISALLYGLGLLIQSVLGQTPLRVRLAVARKELQNMLEEGHEEGLLQPAQRNLANNLFAFGDRSVAEFCIPLARVSAVASQVGKPETLRLAHRQRRSLIPVCEPGGRELVGYVRVVDLHLDDSPQIGPIRPLLDLPHNQSHVAALIALQSAREELARVLDDQQQTIGLVYLDDLTEPIFRRA